VDIVEVGRQPLRLEARFDIPEEGVACAHPQLVATEREPGIGADARRRDRSRQAQGYSNKTHPLAADPHGTLRGSIL
jgi:hypothetical protein